VPFQATLAHAVDPMIMPDTATAAFTAVDQTFIFDSLK
jgi:hypothetical protein